MHSCESLRASVIIAVLSSVELVLIELINFEVGIVMLSPYIPLASDVETGAEPQRGDAWTVVYPPAQSEPIVLWSNVFWWVVTIR